MWGKKETPAAPSAPPEPTAAEMGASHRLVPTGTVT